MGNSGYLKGARFERDFMEEIREQGNHYPIRSAGSHTPFDVILIPLGVHSQLPVIVCQLKRAKKYAPKPPESFRSLGLGDCVTKWWVTRIDREKYRVEVV